MITYSNEAGTVCAEDVIDGLFAGWPHPPTAQQLIDVMDNSYARVWAFSDGRVIGYVNALSDGILTAFIPWLEVHPDYQGQGIGSELLRRILGATRWHVFDRPHVRSRNGGILRAFRHVSRNWCIDSQTRCAAQRCSTRVTGSAFPALFSPRSWIAGYSFLQRRPQAIREGASRGPAARCALRAL